MKITQNWIDRALAAVDPVGALRRVQARHSLALLGGTDAWHGADSRRRANRNLHHLPRTSGDSATLPALAALRDTSRDLVRNNPIAGGAVAGVTTSVVGTGLSVQPQLLAKRLKLTETAVQDWQAEAKELFELWAGRAEWCDLAARLNFYGLQELAFRSALESGDVFALLPLQRIGREPFATKVQLIEADRVCSPSMSTGSADEWAGGVRVDINGRPLQAAVSKRHPADGYSLQRAEFDIVDFIGARTGRRNLLHLATLLRPGQRRGVPYLAPIVEPLRQIGLYTDAEIMAAVVQGAFTVFVEKPEPDSPFGNESSGTPVPAGEKDGNEVGLDYGAIVDLLPGEKASFANPSRPNAAFDPFVQAVFSQIGIALELPKEVLLKHYASSYSAARAALLEAWRFFRKRREWLAAQFCQPVYEAVITEAVLDGRLRAPGFTRDELTRACYLRAVWIGDAPGAIDPLKEVDAAARRIEIGISDKAAETVAHSGRNWEDVHAQRVRERDAEERDGLLPAAPAPAAPAAEDDDEPPAGDDADDAEQEAAREERANAMLSRLGATIGSATAQAIQAMPAPVVNVMPAAAPVVNVEPAAVHVSVPESPVYMEAILPSAAAPVVNVSAAAPRVDVHVPPEGAREQLIERDAAGEIRRIVTRPVEGKTHVEK